MEMKITIVLLLTVLAITVAQADYCPQKPDIECIVTQNECCKDSDCKNGKICCQENCGTVCHEAVKQQTNGTRITTNPKYYCPQQPNIVCIRAQNQCCKDSDCGNGQFCCSENCGNVCHSPVTKRTNGRRVGQDSGCKISKS
ncbi:unnamed protein product [Larinioides sclopetarius]|uniref:WAP domain-containing protein n=1 Tax=Larinioides sclopetarius TaxID=280406 RepID=A0AAV1YTJ1_9ARAC